MASTSVALVFGYYLWDKLIVYSTNTACSHVFHVFASVYGVMFFCMVMFRIEYSRYQILMSFALALMWIYGLIYFGKRTKKIRVAMVPGGKVERVRSNELVDLLPLNRASVDPACYDAIVANFRAELPLDWERFLAKAALLGVPVFHEKSLSEAVTGCVQIEHLSENSFGTIMPSLFYARAKRILDLASAILMLPIFVPVIGLAALLIKIESRGPILFVQERKGFRGRVFRIYKLRNMVDGAHTQKNYTEENDPRITTIGRILRKTRIDEFPQIFNIFKGDMSWIGPRPEAVTLSNEYESEIPFYSYRHIVRPGITGWAQVNQGNVAQVSAVTTKLHFDFYYIKYFSPWLDLTITVKTAAVMLTGFGSR